MISKTAHVIAEVVIGKEVAEKIETIRSQHQAHGQRIA